MSDNQNDGVEIDLRFDESTIARVDWIARMSWTDRETVLRVLIASAVGPSGTELMDRCKAGEVECV